MSSSPLNELQHHIPSRHHHQSTIPEITNVSPDEEGEISALPPSSSSSDDGPRTEAGVKVRTAVIITCVAVITGVNTFLSGVLVVAIPTIKESVGGLEGGMMLWCEASLFKVDQNFIIRPITIQALTCGCTLLLAGSIADVVGSRPMYLLGALLQTLTSIACGLSRTGLQLIVFRALAGIAASLCLPSVVSIINDAFRPGRGRNLAFAAMGGGQPVGFGLGLTLGGVLTESIGWEWGFYLSAIINGAVFGLSAWQLPRSVGRVEKVTWKRLREEVDWVGACVVSIALAMLSYELAVVSTSSQGMREPRNIGLLTVALTLLVVFVGWMHRQEKRQKAALIPNSLWKDEVFTSICINVFLVWGSFNAVEQIGNFFFQNIQGLNSLQAALRFLPAVVTGFVANIIVGLLVHRIRANWIVVISTVLSCSSPLLMALVRPTATYWAFAFPAIALNPVGADGIFTISNLLIASMFPVKTQGLAGGVFNTISQIGKSVGLALTTVVASGITAASSDADKGSVPALMEGYRAGFWFIFALSGTSLCMSIWGLRKVGTVGKKQD
ncbi:MAG: hypothetical protein Q9179_006367 [Wetmoreana sp. 5 TL-2023]